MEYKDTQPGYVTGTALGTGALITYASFRAEADKMGWTGGLMTAAFFVGAVLFASLTVVVNDEELRFYFGPGFWERCFPLDDIQRAEVVRNSALYGWGIRYTYHGWLYNVSGLRAVEVTVRGEGTIRIGTDEPEKLKRALDQARRDAAGERH